MKKDDVEVGGTYLAKVGTRNVEVRVEAENGRGGWNAVSVATGKPVRVKDAKRLRPAKTAPDGAPAAKVTKAAKAEPAARPPAAAAAPTDAAAEPDAVPLTQTDKERKARGGRKPKAAAPGGEKNPKAMSCLDAAAAVLKAEGRPMQCKTMVELMRERGLWSSTAPTPAATLGSAILREMTKKGAASRFRKTGPGHFALNDA